MGELTAAWFRDGGTEEEKKGGSGAGGGRREDVELLFGRDGGRRRSGTTASEGQQMLDALEIKSERPDCDGSDDGGEGYRGWAPASSRPGGGTERR